MILQNIIDVVKPKVLTPFEIFEQAFKGLDKVLGLQLLNFKEDLTTPRDFLLKFYKTYNRNYNTVHSSNPSSIVTYTNKRRSINEVYYLMLSYFPDYALIDYIRDLFDIIAECYFLALKNDKDSGYKNILTISYCPDVRRNVMSLRSIINEYVAKHYNALAGNKFFPIPFVWGGRERSFLSILNNADFCQDLFGDKYIQLIEQNKDLFKELSIYARTY